MALEWTSSEATDTPGMETIHQKNPSSGFGSKYCNVSLCRATGLHCPLALVSLTIGIILGSVFTQHGETSIEVFEKTCDTFMGSTYDSSFCYSHTDSVLTAPVVDSKFSFLVIGDWGRNGYCCQNDVAEEMSKISVQLATNCTVNVGDNFYQSGIQSEHSNQVDTSWTKVYNRGDLLTKPWYTVLGNHDYYGNPRAQLKLPALYDKWVLPNRSYKKSFGDNFLDMIYVDTTPLIKDYWSRSGFAGKVDVAMEEYREQVLNFLNSSLHESTATWRLVVGHHPVFTIGEHHTEDSSELFMRSRFAPVLAEHRVVAYFCGHDHNLQHLHDPETQVNYFISGAGSKIRPQGKYVTEHIDRSVFHLGAQGFAYVSLNTTHMRVAFIDARGTFVYQTVVEASNP